MVAQFSQRSMSEGAVRVARHIGHVEWLTLEEERTQVLMHEDPNMCPQRSETGFSVSVSSVYCSRQILHFL